MKRVLGAVRTDEGLSFATLNSNNQLEYVPATLGMQRFLPEVINWLQDPANWEPPLIESHQFGLSPVVTNS